MKEYLLSRFLSSIITKSSLSTAIDRRTGRAKDSSFTQIGEKGKNSLPTNHKLLEDEGSVQYSTWLKRYLYTILMNYILHKLKRKKFLHELFCFNTNFHDNILLFKV